MNVSDNDIAFLKYMRSTLRKMKAEQDEFQKQLDFFRTNQAGVPFVLKIPATITASTTNSASIASHTHTVGFSTSYPRGMDEGDIGVMMDWLNGEDVMKHILSRD